MIRRILVPVDFSPASLQAAAKAGELAAQLGARIRFLTVLDVGDLRAALKAHLHGFDTEAEVHRALLRWIREQWRHIRPPDGVSFTRAVRRGVVEHEIMRAIRGYRPHLVVMGSSGLMRRLPLGSKTLFVLRRSPVPVVVSPLRTV